MAILIVTYDLKQPGKDYSPVHRYLKRFTHCKDLESVWLLDTPLPAAQVRDGLQALVDRNDKVFVARLNGQWASFNLECGRWLNDSSRSWARQAA